MIIGGHDRGIDYDALIERLRQEPRPCVVLMDASGRRIHPLLGCGAHVRLVGFDARGGGAERAR